MRRPEQALGRFRAGKGRVAVCFGRTRNICTLNTFHERNREPGGETKRGFGFPRTPPSHPPPMPQCRPYNLYLKPLTRPSACAQCQHRQSCLSCSEGSPRTHPTYWLAWTLDSLLVPPLLPSTTVARGAKYLSAALS